jgi:hypothetical protein
VDSEAVLVGTKDYLPPDGLGRVVAIRCYIDILRDESRLDISRYFGKPVLKTPSGFSVWTWELDMEEFGDRRTRLSSLYATQIGSYVVVANNMSELQNVTEEIASYKDGGVLAHLREWDSFQLHDFWGYRKYRDNQSRAFPTIFNGLVGIQSEAEAMILYVDFEHKEAVLHFLSTNPADRTPQNLSKDWGMPPAKSVGRGEWEIQLPLTGSLAETSLQVLWLFGLGVAV